jgi:hypothetical protein
MLAVGLGIHIPRLYAEEKMCKDQINRIKEFLASGEKPQKGRTRRR